MEETTARMKYDFDVDTDLDNHSHMGLVNRINPKERVLELGCATGYLSNILKEQLDCYVVGVEIDAEAGAQASNYCDRVIIADLDTDHWIENLEGETFDVILCADVLEHLKNPDKTLSALKPFLDSNGRLLASIPNVAHASVRLELLQGHFDYEKLGLMDETHLHFYTRNGLVNMLMDAGFVCYDIAYTLSDLADEAIQDHLNKLGLSASEQTMEAFHQPDAQAYQFIVEARPAHEDVLKHRISPLHPKPLETSDAYYGQKQEKIVNLEQQIEHAKAGIEQLQKHNSVIQEQAKASIDQLKKHSSAVEEQRDILQEKNKILQGKHDALEIHNANIKQHSTELAEKYNSLLRTSWAMDDELFGVREELQGFRQLKENYERVLVDRNRLEEVLQRVHGKLSYRILQFLRNLIKGRLFKRERTKNSGNHINYISWVENSDKLNKQELPAIKKDISSTEGWPKIAILMPVYNPSKQHLEEAIKSVVTQVYPNWELCIADDNSDQPHVRKLIQRYARHDKRIKAVFREFNGHISQASNSAMELVDAEYVALMDHDDVLVQDALYRIAKEIKANPDVELMYSDEDKLNEKVRRFAPYFKPDWNPDLFLSHNFICHLGVYKTERIRQLGGFRSEYDGAQDFDLALRYVECIDEKNIIHIPRILYHWRAIPGSTANGVHEKPYAEAVIKKAVENALERRHVEGEVLLHDKLPGSLRIRYGLPEKLPLVSIIIPTRNGFFLLKRCIESILDKTDYSEFEILIIDNGSDDVVTLRYLQKIQEHDKIKVIRDDRPFNYAALNNAGVRQANGEVIALLNDDLEVITVGWLREMVSLALRAETGAVGAKLYYPDDTLQHAGVITGLGGVAGHSHKHFPKDNPGFCGRLLLTQNLSAVTAACMVVRKTVFESVGGFDEENLSVAFNDVDLCLRIREKGYVNVWTPYAEMYHYESATRGYEDTPEKQARFAKEIDYMKSRWEGNRLMDDPAYNPNLTLDREDFSLTWPPRLRSGV